MTKLSAGESHNLTESSDREIYKAIMEAINARETIDINGGDYAEDIGPEEP